MYCNLYPTSFRRIFNFFSLIILSDLHCCIGDYRSKEFKAIFYDDFHVAKSLGTTGVIVPIFCSLQITLSHLFLFFG